MKIPLRNIKISIKNSPEDFQVEEVVDFCTKVSGEFGVYLLKKWRTNTWDVIEDLKKRLRRKGNEISYAGLKDRHAITSQHITIFHGPKKDIRGKNYLLKYLGQIDRPITRADLKGNKFIVKIKVSKNVPEKKFLQQIELIKKFGIPNYYDDQRFSSVSKNKVFFAKELILKRYKNALYTILVHSSHKESSKTKKFRECLKKKWGNFSECIQLSPLSWERKVIETLSSGKLSNSNCKRALSLIHREFLFFQCNVYQSYIWNKVLITLLQSFDIPLNKIDGDVFDIYFYESLTQKAFNKLHGHYIPLPGPKILLDANIQEAYNSVLRDEGIKCINAFRTRVKGAVFKSTMRQAIVVPQIYKWKKITPYVWKIEFFMDKGAYATVFLKRLFSSFGGENEK